MLLSTREFLTFLFKDLRRTALVAALVMLVAAAAAVWVVPKYAADSTLLVLLAPEYGYRPDAGSGATVNVTIDRDAILNSEIAILTSPSVEKDAISKLGVETLYPDLVGEPGLLHRGLDAVRSSLAWLQLIKPLSPTPTLEIALNQFRRSLKAIPDKSANVIDVTFSHRDPEVAAAVVNTLIAAYLDKRHEIYVDVQSNLLQQQADALRHQLDAISQTYADNAAQNSISDYSKQIEEYVQQKADLEGSVRDGDANIAQLKNRVAATLGQLGSTPSTVVQYSDNDADRRVEALREKLADAQARVSSLTQQYNDQNPLLVQARREVETLQTEIDNASTGAPPSSVRTARSQIYETLSLDHIRAQDELDAAQARQVKLRAQLASITDEIATFASKKTRLDELGRQKSLVEDDYSSVMKALADRRMTESLDAHKAANVRIVQPAEPPLSPAPVRLVILAAGVFLGLLAAVATVFLSYALRRSYFTPEDLERGLGVPTLTSLRLMGLDPSSNEIGAEYGRAI